MNIVQFKSKPKPKITNQINHETVKSLEHLLKLAKKGEVLAFAGCFMSDVNTMDNVWAGDLSQEYLSFMGMLTDLQIDLKQSYEEQ